MSGLKLFLFAVDGMDFLYVKRYGLRLAGKVWRIESRTDVNTPHLWALVQSGCPPKKDVFVYAPLWARLWCRLTGSNIRRYYRWADKRFLRCRSIFDEYRSAAFNFPMYKWDLPEVFREYGIPEALGDRDKSLKLLEETRRDDENRMLALELFIDRVMDKFKLKYDIVALWIYSIDVLNHLFPKDKLTRLELYRKVNGFAKKMSYRGIPIVVLSDHGGRDGVHTRDAVFSTNIGHDWYPSKIEHVYGWLREILEK